MREGNIQQLDRCIRENQFRFIQAGTFLLVEKLKLYVHRRLFKRVALLHREQEPAKAERLPLGSHEPGPPLHDSTFAQAHVFRLLLSPHCLL